ncbi:MAG: hypothetical protein IPK87_12975 [Planctomycetes bacterium]|nr:hypothetical protein [Planctomycetota bacterium]
MRWLLLLLMFATPLCAQSDMVVLRDTVVIAVGATDSLQNTGASPFNLTYTIRNDGATDLDLTSMPPVALSGESNCTVIVLQDPVTPVAMGATTTFRLQVSPIAATAFSFDVSIASNDPVKNPYTFTFEGNAVAPAKKKSTSSRPDDCSTGVGGTSRWWLLAVLALGLLALRRVRPD